MKFLSSCCSSLVSLQKLSWLKSWNCFSPIIWSLLLSSQQRSQGKAARGWLDLSNWVSFFSDTDSSTHSIADSTTTNMHKKWIDFLFKWSFRFLIYNYNHEVLNFWTDSLQIFIIETNTKHVSISYFWGHSYFRFISGIKVDALNLEV